MSMSVSMRIRAMTAPHWLGFFGLVLLAWAALFIGSVGTSGDLSSVYGVDYWVSLCSSSAGQAGLAPLFAMWAVMSAAMMAPTFLPALATFDDLRAGGATDRTGFFLLLAGYLIVWLGFSALAAGAQMVLARAGMLDGAGRSTTPYLTAGLLIVAGAYQFSALKEACLTQCRMPMTFFMEHWRPGRFVPVEMGLRLGAVCLGCCWALMALAFVGGTMNLVWMGAATVLMILEKLPEIGRPITRPLGYGLICAGLVTAALAAF